MARAPDQNKIANREPFWELDHTANLVQLRTCTENTSAVLSVKADLSDQSERLVETYRSAGRDQTILTTAGMSSGRGARRYVCRMW
jgi:hypothetical protein